MLDKTKLFKDVFAPQPDDTVLIMVDMPHGEIADNADWADRRAMADEWRDAFRMFDVKVLPLLTFPATGANNGDLPRQGEWNGESVDLEETMRSSTILLAMTRYSATAPLARLAKACPTLRVASMPGVLRRMEQTALAADYAEVARRTHILADLLTPAESATVVFSTGDRLFLDLRYRTGHADDGQCRRDKPFPLINLPSGESFIVPYEGERPGEPSRTEGMIPLVIQGEHMTLEIHANRIAKVLGDGPEASKFRAHLDLDPARRNVAELGLGCNDKAVVQGAVIEDEKAGFHWAYGRSEHLGGTVGPKQFSDPAHVIHQDIVYAPASPIGIREVTLHGPDQQDLPVIRDNQYVTF